jgi:hypothetical protein
MKDSAESTTDRLRVLTSRVHEATEELDAMGYPQLARALSLASGDARRGAPDLDRLEAIADEGRRCAVLLAPEGYELPPSWETSK